MNDRETIQKMIDLFQDPERWTGYFLAKNKYGSEVPPTDPEACCFCAVGAFKHFQAEHLINNFDRFIKGLYKEAKDKAAVVWVNDYLGREILLQVLEKYKEML